MHYYDFIAKYEYVTIHRHCNAIMDDYGNLQPLNVCHALIYTQNNWFFERIY